MLYDWFYYIFVFSFWRWNISTIAPQTDSSEYCKGDFLTEQRIQSKITTVVLAIFFVSLLGVGMGQTAVYTLGIPYIDDNVASRESPLYFGKFFHQFASYYFILFIFFILYFSSYIPIFFIATNYTFEFYFFLNDLVIYLLSLFKIFCLLNSKLK